MTAVADNIIKIGVVESIALTNRIVKFIVKLNIIFFTSNLNLSSFIIEMKNEFVLISFFI